MDNEQKANQSLTVKLKSILATHDKFALAEFKAKVNMAMIVASDEPNFIDLKRDWGLRELLGPVAAITESFLRNAFPDQAEMSFEASMMLIEREPTWTLPDVLNFYKTIVNRQDLEGFKVFGNKITLLKLAEMVGAYEGLKAEEREIYHAKLKGEKIAGDPQRYVSDNSVKALMGKALEQVQIKNDGKKSYGVPADEKYFAKYTEPDIPIEYQDSTSSPQTNIEEK